MSLRTKVIALAVTSSAFGFATSQLVKLSPWAAPWTTMLWGAAIIGGTWFVAQQVASTWVKPIRRALTTLNARTLGRGDEVSALAELAAEAEQRRRGELSRRGEAGQLARASVTNLREALKRVEEDDTRLREQSMQDLQVSAALRDEMVRGATAMESFHLSVRGSIDIVNHLVTQSRQVSHAMEAMNRLVASISVDTQQLYGSVDVTVRNAVELDEALVRASEANSQIVHSVRRVAGRSQDGARLSSEASKAAQDGMEAINRSVEMIARMQTLAREAAGAMQQLRESVAEVAGILDVINDIAVRTNLLALNASIIAAQAGENGRSFAVVAEEIKVLAERTRASTNQIGDRIQRIQERSRETESRIEETFAGVEESVHHNRAVETTFSGIVSLSENALEVVDDIAQTATRQLRAAEEALRTLNTVLDTTHSLRQESSRQANRMRVVRETNREMMATSENAHEASQRQEQKSADTRDALTNIFRAVDAMTGSYQEQLRISQTLEDALASSRRFHESRERAVQAARRAAETLAEQAGRPSDAT